MTVHSEPDANPPAKPIEGSNFIYCTAFVG